MNDDALLAIADLDARLAALASAVSAPDAPIDSAHPPDTQPGQPGPSESRSSQDAAKLIQWSERLGRLVGDLSVLRADVDAAVTRLLDDSRQPPGSPPAARPPGEPVAPRDPRPPSVPIGFDRLLTGHLTIDAGPFADVTGVANFKRALQRIPATHAVTMTGFTDDRARFTIELAEPVALGHAIRGVVPFNFSLSETGPRTLALNLAANSPAARRAGPPA